MLNETENIGDFSKNKLGWRNNRMERAEVDNPESELCDEAKWFGRPQEERVKAVVDAKVEEILRTLCVAKFCKDCKHWKKENLPYGICKDNKWSNHGYDFACKDFEESEEE